MSDKSKVKPVSRILEDRRRKRKKSSDNVYVSPSFIRRFKKFARKQKSEDLKNCSGDQQSSKTVNRDKVIPALPKDTAVHFGSFYGVKEIADKAEPVRTNSSFEAGGLSFNGTGPKSEFTRQMVHKLERTAGTEEYARQVSALLEETVEPAHFKLHSLPTENSIPDGRQNPSGFPLWYRDPYKMPFASEEIYKLLKEKYGDVSSKGRDVFKDDSSEEESCEELSDEEDRNSYDLRDNNSVGKEESLLNILSSTSTSGTEAKDTDSTGSTNISVNEKTKEKS